MLLLTKVGLLLAGAGVSIWRRTHRAKAKSSKAAGSEVWLEEMAGGVAKDDVDENLVVSATATGLALGGVACPPLGLASIMVLGGAIWPVVRNSLKNLRDRRQPASSILDLSMVPLILFTGYSGGVAVMLFGYHLSRKLLYISEDRSTSDFIDVFTDRSQSVWVQEGSVEVQRPLSELEVGDVVVLNAGEVVPVDGVVLDGLVLLDQRALTGESQPVERVPDDAVLASGFVVAGGARVRVTQAGRQTTAARIGQMLQQTRDFKSSLLSRGERVIEYSALPTLGLSGLAFLTLKPAAAFAIAMSGVGYPARIGIPISILSYLRIASQEGILIKDGRSLELLGGVDTVVFDKTGTLTEEIPAVGQILPRPGVHPDDLLRLTAAAEAKQVHPIAQAIRRAAAARGLSLPPATTTRCQIGLGLQVLVEGREITVGSARLMASEGIDIPEDLAATFQSAINEGFASLVYVAIDGRFAGAIELVPAIRPEAPAVVSALRELGMTLYILSGDQEAPTRRLAQQLGIAEYAAEMLPEDKAEKISQLREEGRSICFVGDGINDAIALKRADVSVSLSGASTVAIDTAMVVLMRGSLSQLLTAFDIAGRMKENLFRGTVASILPGTIGIGSVLIFNAGVFITISLFELSLALCVLNGLVPVLSSGEGDSTGAGSTQSPGAAVETIGEAIASSISPVAVG